MAMIACIKATAGEATQGLETNQVPFQSLGYKQDLERVLLGLSGEIGVEDLSEALAPIESFYPDMSAGVNSGEGIESEPPLYIGTRIMYWYHPDYVSNVDMVTDKSGEAYELFLYNAWGESLHHWTSSSTNSWSSPYRLNSKELDSETGMHYYGARYHHPKLSVWMSVDPLAHQTLEAYQFTGNNPIALIDPDGNSTHTDAEGNVVAVYEDGYLGVYMHDDLSDWDKNSILLREGEGITLMGHTLYEKSFMNDNGVAVGKIEFGSTKAQDWLNRNERSIQLLADPMRLGNLKTRLLYAANAGSGDLYDYKSSVAGSTYEGSQISDGVYASARDVGNYFAGSVARITNQNKKDFLVTAGAFNLHGNNKLDLLMNLNRYKTQAAQIPVTYGEDERSNYFQRLGFEGLRDLKSFNRNYSRIWKD